MESVGGTAIAPGSEEVSAPAANGIDPVSDFGVASSKKPEPEDKRSRDPRRDQKPIRLNDLIPGRDVKGGRRTVFGSSGATPPPIKRKPQK